jgi:hypothetical protein
MVFPWQYCRLYKREPPEVAMFYMGMILGGILKMLMRGLFMFPLLGF